MPKIASVHVGFCNIHEPAISIKLFTYPLYRIILILEVFRIMFVNNENIKIKTSRSSGPGGQNVNKRSTRVQVWVNIGDLDISEAKKKKLRIKLANKINEKDELETESDEERAQEQNRDRAIEKLNELIKEALYEEKPRIPTGPHQGSIEERLHHKRLRYQKKKSRREAKGVGVEEHSKTF